MPAPANPLPLILLPGMGADARIFAPQHRAFGHLTVPPWLEPQPWEPLTDYAARWAKQIDPMQPCIIGGLSLGGMLAIEMSRHLDAKACILLASVRSPRELPRRVRIWRCLPKVTTMPVLLGPAWAKAVRFFARWMMSDMQRSAIEQLAQTRGSFLRWATWAILTWKHSDPPTNIPVFHLHGSRDHVLPSRHVQADRLVPGAGHIITLTHGDDVNAFIAHVLEQVK